MGGGLGGTQVGPETEFLRSSQVALNCWSTNQMSAEEQILEEKS